MFKIKTKVDYGLMIMCELAKRPGQVVSLSPIAKKLKISSIYLIQISQLLARAGLISSREGSQGGYVLERPASKISLLEIIEALEGGIKVRCAVASDKCCPNSEGCELRNIWTDVLGDLKSVLRDRSLASLVK